MNHFFLKKNTGDLIYNEKWLGRLSQSEIEVISCLYEHKGEVVSKENLISAGWPNKIVTPNSLNVAIKNIRLCLEKALIEDAIETHVKKGFSWNENYPIEVIISTTSADSNITFEKQESYRHEPLLDKHIQVNANTQPDSITSDQLPIREQSHSSIKILMHIICIGLLSFLSVLLISFYLTYRTSLTCHQISTATFCGVGEIRRDMIPKNPVGGNYLFGYNAPGGEFYYVKI